MLKRKTWEINMDGGQWLCAWGAVNRSQPGSLRGMAVERVFFNVSAPQTGWSQLPKRVWREGDVTQPEHSYDVINRGPGSRRNLSLSLLSSQTLWGESHSRYFQYCERKHWEDLQNTTLGFPDVGGDMLFSFSSSCLPSRPFRFNREQTSVAHSTRPPSLPPTLPQPPLSFNLSTFLIKSTKRKPAC